MKILLLNLPYKDKKLQRDFSCAHSSKADYYWTPIDLVVYSAIFSDQELFFIDSIQEKMKEDDLTKKLDYLKPDYIFTLISAISFKDDLNIIRDIKMRNSKIKISASGDLCSFNPVEVAKNNEIDFVISDFTEKEEIRKIIFNKQINKIIYSSNKKEFEIGVPKINELLNEMIKAKLNLKWSCEFRVDLVNEKVLNLMKKAGCFLIFYGGESGNQKTLNLMNKGVKLEDIKNAITLTKKIGIETLISFIIGFELETEEEIINTERFIMNIDPDYISINIYVPRIGSNLRKEIKSEEMDKLDSSTEFGIRYPSGKFTIDYKKNIEKDFFLDQAN